MEFLLSVITEHIIFVFLICHVKNKRCGGISIKYMVYIPSVGIIQIRLQVGINKSPLSESTGHNIYDLYNEFKPEDALKVELS